MRHFPSRVQLSAEYGEMHSVRRSNAIPWHRRGQVWCGLLCLSREQASCLRHNYQWFFSKWVDKEKPWESSAIVSPDSELLKLYSGFLHATSKHTCRHFTFISSGASDEAYRRLLLLMTPASEVRTPHKKAPVFCWSARGPLFFVATLNMNLRLGFNPSIKYIQLQNNLSQINVKGILKLSPIITRNSNKRIRSPRRRTKLNVIDNIVVFHYEIGQDQFKV